MALDLDCSVVEAALKPSRLHQIMIRLEINKEEVRLVETVVRRIDNSETYKLRSRLPYLNLTLT